MKDILWFLPRHLWPNLVWRRRERKSHGSKSSRKKHSTLKTESTARCPVSFRQAISRFKITPSYIVYFIQNLRQYLLCATHCRELILSTSAAKEWTQNPRAWDCTLLIICFLFLDTGVNHTVYLNMLQMWFLATCVWDSSQSNNKPAARWCATTSCCPGHRIYWQQVQWTTDWTRIWPSLPKSKPNNTWQLVFGALWKETFPKSD
jgi:hypothetical protein